MTTLTPQHVTVFLREAVDALKLKPGDHVVDATVGKGGHTAELLRMVGPQGKVIGLDRDSGAIAAATERFEKEIATGQLVLVQSPFSELSNVRQELAISQVDGVLMDLGVSTEQLLSPTRGFSFQHDAPLDMRMDTREDFTAARLLAEWEERQLQQIFFEAGEKSYASRLARAIVQHRKQNALERTSQLVDLITRTVPARSVSGRATHVATKVFLALRMAVNHEMEQLKQGLESALVALKPNARLAVITFHSLEDGHVKRTFLGWAADCVCPPELPICTCDHRSLVTIETKKPIVPSEDERALNPRARSAKLRICQKI
jgi:16S rRNA (cytosine1402-N4)-methyltransferase